VTVGLKFNLSLSPLIKIKVKSVGVRPTGEKKKAPEIKGVGDK